MRSFVRRVKDDPAENLAANDDRNESRALDILTGGGPEALITLKGGPEALQILTEGVQRPWKLRQDGVQRP